MMIITADLKLELLEDNLRTNKATQSSINYRIQIKTNLVILEKHIKFKTSLKCAYRNNSTKGHLLQIKEPSYCPLLCSYTSLFAHCDCNII